MYTQLNIKNFETYFVLGNNPDEKFEKRKVIINIALRFPDQEIAACVSDNLDDTICYATMLKFISAKLQDANFNLIEKACGFLYDIISVYVKEHSANSRKFLLRVEVVKPCPPVENLESASFICSDW